MARKAALSVAEAEDKVLALAGPRPIHFKYDSDTSKKTAIRAAIRQWFSAKGIPSKANGMISYPECEAAFNSDKDFARVYAKYQQARDEAKAAGNDTDEDEDNDEDTVVASGPEYVHQDKGNGTNGANGANPTVEQLAALLGQLLSKGSLDKDGVNAIIDTRLKDLPELVAKYAEVHRVVLVAQDGTFHKVEGHAHPMLPKLIKAMSSRQANGKHPNIFLSGPTGSGKTHGVEQASQALGLEFFSNGAISMDYQLIGFKDANGNYHETPLRKAFSRPATYLFDEIDSSLNSPILALAGALANNGYGFPDAFVERHPDCVIVAAGNTWGNGATADFVGRNKLDAAIKSRFPIRLAWDYDEALERNISGNIDWACRVQKARAKARVAGLKVIIDPRMTQAGAALIAAGFSEDETAAFTYLAELSAEQRKIIETE